MNAIEKILQDNDFSQVKDGYGKEMWVDNDGQGINIYADDPEALAILNHHEIISDEKYDRLSK